MSTAVTLKFADGEYTFDLRLPQAIELERATGNTSLFEIYERLSGSIGVSPEGEYVFAGGGSGMVTDVRETIRLMLIGGGEGVVSKETVEIGPIRAQELVEAYVYPARPLGEGALLAWRALHAQINGIETKGSKKKEAEISEESASQKDG